MGQNDVLSLELIDKGIARTGYTVMNLDGKK